MRISWYGSPSFLVPMPKYLASNLSAAASENIFSSRCPYSKCSDIDVMYATQSASNAARAEMSLSL